MKAKFTTLAGGWKHHVEMMKPAPKDYHAHERAYYAGALSYGGIMSQAFNNLPGPQANSAWKALQAEAVAFAEEQIKLHESNINN